MSVYNFSDYVNTDDLTDLENDILNSFTFNLVETKNYNWAYFDNYMLEINQLNYGVKRYDISNEDDLIKELADCIEFDQLDSGDKNFLIDMFVEAIDNFIQERSN